MFGSKESRMAKIGKFAATFLTGAAIGIGVGLLVAPKTGRKLQKELKNNLEDFGDLMKEQAEMARIGLRNTGHAVQDIARRVAHA